MKKFFACISFLMMMLLISISNVKAQNTYTSISSVDEIPTYFANSQSYLSSSEANLKDYLGYFTGSNSGWEPRIKYLGTDPNSIENYLFCLSYHDLAPKSSITYTKSEYDTVTKMNQIRYIIENGFGGTFATYDDLKYAYYVTQLAIWQLQGTNGFDIESFNTSDTVTKNAILNLVSQAKSASIDTTKYVGKYVPSTSGYQMLVPNIIYTLETTTSAEETTTNYTTSSSSKIKSSSRSVTTYVGISYKDSCDGSYVTGAKMRLVNSSNIEVESWTSSKSVYYISGLEAGTYTLQDLSSGVSMKIGVTQTSTTQKFTMYTDDTCTTYVNSVAATVENDGEVTTTSQEETTTVTETIITEISNIINPDTGVVSTITAGSLLTGGTGLFAFSRKKLKKLRK